jgi:hypothetical protein
MECTQNFSQKTWRKEELGKLGMFKSEQRLGIFLFTAASRLALGPTLSLIQWVPRALSLGVKLLRCEADHSPPSSAEVEEYMELYLHSPIHHGMVLS